MENDDPKNNIFLLDESFETRSEAAKGMIGYTPYSFNLAMNERDLHAVNMIAHDGSKYNEDALTRRRMMHHLNKDIVDNGVCYQFDEDLLQILMDSEATSKIELPYPRVFINNDIKYGDVIIKGIGAHDTVEDANYIFISFYIYEISSERVSSGLIRLLKDEYLGKSEPGYGQETVENGELTMLDKFDEEKYSVKKMSNILANMIKCMSHSNDDLFTVEINNHENNIKREKRGQERLTPLVKYIRLTGQTKIYAKAYTEACRSLTHQVKVKGHIRTFKSERYVNVQGDSVWIMPFIKGANLPPAPEVKLIKVISTKNFRENKVKELLE